MKYFLVLLLFFGVFIYLNRTYSHIYSTIGNSNLQSPYKRRQIQLDSSHKKTVKYVAIGDSLSAGVGSQDYKQTFTYYIAQTLAKTSNVTFVDLAVPGATTQNLINNQLDNTVKQNPDFVTVLIGVNDIHNFVPPNQFAKNYQTIIQTLLNKTHAQVVVINIPYLGSNKLIYPPFSFLFDLATRYYDGIIKNLSKNPRVQLVDLYDGEKILFENNNMLYSSDQFHPSEKGYKLWGQIINGN